MEQLRQVLLRSENGISDVERDFNRWKKEQEDERGQSAAAEVGLGLEGKVAFRSSAHAFFSFVVASAEFQRFIMLVILINSISLAVQVSVRRGTSEYRVIQILDLIFLVIYTSEFVAKLYCEPRGYWRSNYNRFDFVILLFSYVEYQRLFVLNVTFVQIFRALRALRALRTIAFVRSLKILISALIKTVKSISNVLLLMGLLVFIFGVVGVELFGRSVHSDWGSLGRAFNSLFTIVTLDGWAEYQTRLDEAGLTASRIFIVLYIVVANFILTNSFIGIVIIELDSAQTEERQFQKAKKTVLGMAKKSYLNMRQVREIKRLEEERRALIDATQQVKVGSRRSLLGHGSSGSDKGGTQQLSARTQQLLWELTTARSDFPVVEDVLFDLAWIDCFFRNLDYMEHIAYHTQQQHFDIANTVAELFELSLEHERGPTRAQL
jgi:cation channel sperm-associated protein 3